MCSRPGREDSEDDLLQFQEEFFFNKAKPSVTVVKGYGDTQTSVASAAVNHKRSHERDVVSLDGHPTYQQSGVGGTSLKPPKKKSKFKQRAAQKLQAKQEQVDANELLDRHDTHITSILSQIKERDTHKIPALMPRVSERGFPKVLHRDLTDQVVVSPSKRQQKSLFAQQFMKSSPTSFGIPDFRIKATSAAFEHSSCEENMEVNVELFQSQNGQNKLGHDENSGFPVTPHIISGVGLVGVAGGPSSLTALDERKRIHEENVQTLSAMTNEEILEEQSKIRVSLDPSLITFLQKKQKTKQEQNSSLVNRASDSNMLPTNELPNNNDAESERRGKHVYFSEDVSVIEHSNSLQGEQLEKEISNIDEIKQLASLKWIHMDKIEVQKLEWMKDCPTPTAKEMKDGQQARFDFEGYLVSRSTDIPTHLGLHHHSSEPGAAGYSLEELFLLARSKFLQQRMFALQVLTRIIQRERQGVFHNLLQENLLPILLEAGFVFLLRWALDDNVEAVMSAALQAFAALLINPMDEKVISTMAVWYRGNERPSLCPRDDDNKPNRRVNKVGDEEENRPASDAEIVKKDVITGLLQMKLLPRLRYILEVSKPSAPAVRSILQILLRIARHSLHAAAEITRCPRLLEVIVTEFLPTTWQQVENIQQADDVFGFPLVEAMKLMVALCCAGRHLTAILTSKHDLIGRILCYTLVHPKELKLGTEKESFDLCIESLNLWRVCIGYGLACEHFREVHTTIIQQLQWCICQPVGGSTETDIQRTVTLLGVLEAAIYVAGTTCELQSKLSFPASVITEPCETGVDSLPVPPLNWSHVNGFLPLVGLGMQNWTKEFIDFGDQMSQSRCSRLLSGVFGVITAFYSKLKVQPSYSPVETLEMVESLIENVLGPLMQSTALKSQLGNLSFTFTNGEKIFKEPTITALPDYCCIFASKNENACWLASDGPLPLLINLLRLMCEIVSIHKGVISQFAGLVTNSTLVAYLKRSVEFQGTLPQCLLRMEHHLQYFLIKLFSYVLETDLSRDLVEYVPVYHSAALTLFSRLWPGDEYYACDLISNVLFHPQFFGDTINGEAMTVVRDLAELSIKTEATPTPSVSVTSDGSRMCHEDLLSDAFRGLPHARSTFLNLFLNKEKEAVDTSRRLSLPQPHLIKSLLLPSCQSEPLLPGDWMFLPILELHNKFVDAETKDHSDVESVTNSELSSVTASLQLILLLEEFRPSSLRQVSVVSRIARLLCLFLTGSDMFLEKTIRCCLKGLLEIYTKPVYRAQTDFTAPVPGLSSFYDLYSSFISHYKAVSFGDSLFACYVVLPLQQRYDSRFKRAIWDENVEVLRVMSLPIDQLPVPLECYLYPVEQDESLLTLYLRCLATRTVRPSWSPLFYLLAVHHINAFVFQRIDSQDAATLKRKLKMLSHILLVKDEVVRHHLLYYYKPDAGEQSAMKLFKNLPPDRELLLRCRNEPKECCKLYEKMID